MSRRPRITTRISAAVGVALLAGVLFLLIEARPPLPSQPPSLSAPVALWNVEEILVFLAWIALLVLLVALLAMTARTLLRRSPPRVPLVLRDDARRQRARSRALERPNPLSSPYVLTVAEPATGDGYPMTPGRTAVPAPPSQALEGARQQAAVTIRLLGAPAIEGLPRRRRGMRSDCRLFLIYLALHPKGVGRDELTAALWPDLPEGRARQRLYQAASDARSHLGDAFAADGERYRLDRERLEIDIDELERLLHEADIERDGRRERAALEQALGLVRGEPLAALDVPSMDGQARRLSAVVVGLCERLAQVRLADGDPSGALAAAERGISLDELNEELWRLALEAEGALGLRDAVINRYEVLCQRLAERLGIEPQRETRTVYLQLLGQD
jgi:DNA-binding SARP family transcriptional activator